MPIKVLKASAGSGKTYTLTNEYLDLLRNSLHSKILAVTFTNKATEEMKSRIVKELNKRAKEDNDKKAAESLKTILHDYSHFNVSTIDKFFQKVVRSMFRELGFSGIYDLILDKTLLLDEMVNEMRITLDQYPNAYNLLLETAFSKLKEEQDWSSYKDIINLSKYLWKDEFMNLTPKELESYNYENVRNFFAECNKKREDILNEWADLASKIRNSFKVDIDLGPRTKIGAYFTRIDACINKNEEKLQFTEKQLIAIHEILNGKDLLESVLNATDRKKYGKTLHEDGFVVAFLEFLNTYTSTIEMFMSLKVVVAYAQFLPILVEINKLLRDRLIERNELLLSDVNHLLAGMIGKDDAPFIYEKIGTQIQHYLLDEFQDTSTMQWQNFIPLVHNSVSEGKDNLIVGDVKQSIYRWRNSDWDILANGIKSKFVHNVKEDSLEYNWRSKANIVDFNNKFFTKLSASLDENSGLVVGAYSDVTQKIHVKREHSNGGYVNWKVWKKVNGEKIDYQKEELEAIYNDIQEALNKGYSKKDIGILVRGNVEGAVIAKYLLENGIDVISSESLYISSHNDVKLLIFLLKRAVAGQSDLIKLILESLGESFKKDKNSILDNDEIKKASTLPLFEQVERYIQILDLSNKPDSISYIQAFQDLVFDYTQKKSSNINDFLQWWNLEGVTKSVQAGAMSDAVNVMTIHKSKGLDFPVVLVPFCEWPLSSPNVEIKWLKNKIEGLTNTLPILPIGLTKALNGTIFEEEYNKEKLNKKLDNINLLYVALTRPRNVLNIYSAPNGNSYEIYNWVSGVLSNLYEVQMCIDEDDSKITYSYGEIIEKLADEELKEEESKVKQLEGLYPSFNYKSSKVKFRLQTETSEIQQRGNVLHGILQFVKTKEDVARAINKAVRMGLISSKEVGPKKEELEGIVNNPLVSELFDGSYPVVWNERTIIADKNYRPDRIMEKDGELLVVDYKFGEKHDKYYAQIRNYVKLLKQMNKWSNVRGCLYFHETKSLQWV